ncbi:MAG: hypothetical protein HY078_13870 [Elusimicrobia bacterium]|nr:hypothetical protein [Elusimicrobiota bacterium]
MGSPRELDALTLASPCTQSWDAMEGDERVRFCGLCRLNVYNLSAMPRAEAEALVASREGRLCVRFYQRADGTILTRDCPVGLAAFRLRVLKLAGAAAGLCVLLAQGAMRLLGAGGRSDRPACAAMKWSPSPAAREGAVRDSQDEESRSLGRARRSASGEVETNMPRVPREPGVSVDPNSAPPGPFTSLISAVANPLLSAGQVPPVPPPFEVGTHRMGGLPMIRNHAKSGRNTDGTPAEKKTLKRLRPVFGSWPSFADRKSGDSNP